ncbi:MAG: hypothetical protein WCA00_08750 [Candidatus Acidiferrales bacterium]
MLALLVAAMAFHAWLAAHDDQLRMQSTIAAQKQLLDAADARERDRATTLKDTLAQIEALKRSVQTPAEILRDLPKYLPLPQPITIAPSGSASAPEQGSAASENRRVLASKLALRVTRWPPRRHRKPRRNLPDTKVRQLKFRICQTPRFPLHKYPLPISNLFTITSKTVAPAKPNSPQPS